MQTAHDYAKQCQQYAAQTAKDSRNSVEAMGPCSDEDAWWLVPQHARNAALLQGLSRTYYQRARQVMGLED